MFEIKKHLIKVQGGRQYLPVSSRLIWFRGEHPDWGISTRLVAIDMEQKYAICEATIRNDQGDVVGMGHKMEDVRGFGDWLEKAETGAIGRALAVCGFGTQFAPDLDHEVNPFADSPGQPDYSLPAKVDYPADTPADRQEASLVCADCSRSISLSQSKYAARVFGRPLCGPCQDKAKYAQRSVVGVAS